MGIVFNADEIFEMAEQIERNGAAFYRKAAESAEAEESSKWLLDLAAMEDEHEEAFAAMRAELAESERGEAVYDPYDEGVLYLRAFADGHVFDTKANPADRLTGQETMEDVINTAIGLEKDSIVFYLGLRGMVPESLGKDRIDDIVKQEMGHITALSQRLAELN